MWHVAGFPVGRQAQAAPYRQAREGAFAVMVPHGSHTQAGRLLMEYQRSIQGEQARPATRTTRHSRRSASQLAAVLAAPNSVSSGHTPALGGCSHATSAASAVAQPRRANAASSGRHAHGGPRWSTSTSVARAPALARRARRPAAACRTWLWYLREGEGVESAPVLPASLQAVLARDCAL